MYRYLLNDKRDSSSASSERYEKIIILKIKSLFGDIAYYNSSDINGNSI